MNVKNPYSTVLQILFVLGLLFLWGGTAADTRAMNTAALSIDELCECFKEQLEEDLRESLSTGPQLCPSILASGTACLLQVLRTLDISKSNCPSGQPSEWMMPLRI
ncbi:MAG: hypothetical protein K9M45_05575 [Kiritimatiellales bacterium]|nr:hypothetical protein [Kiritimatiellales bacterium]